MGKNIEKRLTQTNIIHPGQYPKMANYIAISQLIRQLSCRKSYRLEIIDPAMKEWQEIRIYFRQWNYFLLVSEMLQLWNVGISPGRVQFVVCA